jgi:beta-glucosidase
MDKGVTVLDLKELEKEESLIKDKAKELVALMTLEEKAGLCSGGDFWHTKPIGRLGIDSIMMTDGPHGLRKQKEGSDMIGINDSVPAVCFPTASALACSFDRELAYEVGKAIGEEALQEGVAIVLGPGANQKRSPLCGRNFEYFSEDPVVSGEMAAGMIEGVQSTGVGTSLKHFAVNNQEKHRMTISTVIDERTLRETYLKAYEIAVKKGKPATVMCAYNRVNGEYCSENEYLLTKILREEWGFDGVVVSDWGAVNDRVLGVKAGLDIEMPGSCGINDAKLIAAVKNGYLSEQELDKAACRVTRLVLKGMLARKDDFRYDAEAHHRLAVKAAEQSAVLLKNKDRILPGNPKQKAAVIGAFAKGPRYQGAGSSKIHPIRLDNPWDALSKQGLELIYAPGYSLKKGKSEDKNNSLILEACEAAKGKDIVYLFAGLPEGYESEGFDRTKLSLPEEHNRLIEAVAACNPNTVVILFGGAPMALPWADRVKGILMAYLAGEGCGTAVADILLGTAVPCGKLAETWPLQLDDTPAYHYFPGGRTTVEYRESIFTGYRYYDTAEKPVQFPFGYGLSYTDFEYSNLRLDKAACEYGDQITATFEITNTGKTAARETALVFAAHQNTRVFLPKKELKEFVKVALEPGETKKVSVVLDTKDFAFYNTKIGDWYAESGTYTIMAGASARDCPLQAVLQLSSPEKPQPDFRETAPAYYRLPKTELVIPEQEFAAIYGGDLPKDTAKALRPYDSGNTLDDVSSRLLGKIIIMGMNRMARKLTKDSREEEAMMAAMIREMPFHSIVTSGGGAVSERMLEGVLDMLNGHYGKGILKLLKKK